MTRPNMAAVLGLCSTLFLVPSVCRADPESLTVTGLAASLAQSEKSTVRFSEERRLQLLTEPLILEGTLTFDPPDHLERVVQRPKWERMVVEGGLMTLEENKRDRPMRLLLKDFPVLKALVSALRMLLAGDAEALERVFEASLVASDDGWSLTLVPRPQSLRDSLRELQVSGRDRRLQSITLIETGGDVSVVTLLGET